MKIEHKVETIKKHFYSSKLGKKEFCEKFHNQYGYANWPQMKKFMNNNGILQSERSIEYLEN